MEHNARSVVAAWRATDSTPFTKSYAHATPSAITQAVAHTYTHLAIHLQQLSADLVHDGFPHNHPLVQFINAFLTTTSHHAQHSKEWSRALAQAELETE